jgi:hypothetical protein
MTVARDKVGYGRDDEHRNLELRLYAGGSVVKTSQFEVRSPQNSLMSSDEQEAFIGEEKYEQN